MKLTTILLLTACLQVSAKSYAQAVTLSMRNAPLEDVVKELKRQTKFNFFYEKGLLQNSSPITITVSNKPFDQTLELCFKNQPFDYKIVGRTVFIRKKTLQSEIVMSSTESVINVQGKVSNEIGEPVEGVTVTVKGTPIGTLTNKSGEFSLSKIDQNAVLVFSGVNVESFEIDVNGRTFLNVKLQTRVTSMQEVIINKGYYSENKKFATGNVATVEGKDVEKQPVQNPLLALSGRVPGLYITQPSGLAGSSVKVRLQGNNSIVNGNEPLYVVDGVPIVSQLSRTGIDAVTGTSGINYAGNGNPMNYINPSDIERIDILKDADATAIYGSRAANGAILITTKKGKAGRMKFDIGMQTGFGEVAKRMKMMNTRQYLDMRYEAFRNDGINWTAPFVTANDLKVWDTTQYTDWQKKLIGGKAKYNDVNLSFSGGTSTVQYIVSGTYHHETTVFPYPNDFSDKKGNVHVGLNANSNNQKFKLQFSSSFLSDRNQLPSIDITPYALQLEPNAPHFLNADGSINWAPNPRGATTLGNANVMLQVYTPYKNKTSNLISNLALGYDVLPGLKINSSIGYNWINTEDFLPSPLIAVRPELRAISQRLAQFGNRRLISWIVEPQISYSKVFRHAKIEALIGSTLQTTDNTSGVVNATGQLSDYMLDNINTANSVTPIAGFADKSEYRYNAVYGRLNYNWKEKYILNLTGRRDGSSRFGSANQFENFGSVGLAWVFSNESLIISKLHFISFGKIRGSFGTTGSDQIGNYGFLSLYSLNTPQVPYQGISGLTTDIIPNPYLQWEKTKKLQAGIDLGFFKDNLSFSLTYAQNRSSNQLINSVFPYTAGITSQPFNFPATVQNINWESSINAVIFRRKNFNWTSNINITVPKNKLIKFPNLETSLYASSLVIGEPITVIKAYPFLGVDPQTGVYLYSDKEKNITQTPSGDDRNVFINLDPTIYGGLQNVFSYKGVQLDFLFQFVRQKGPVFTNWNASRYPGEFFRGQSNQPVSVLERWRTPGDNTSVKKYSTFSDFFVAGSDRNYSDASFLRLKNASLSWALPEKWSKSAHIRTGNVFIRGQNLLTFTSYKGLDPETRSMVSLPPLRVWTIGINAGL